MLWILGRSISWQYKTKVWRREPRKTLKTARKFFQNNNMSRVYGQFAKLLEIEVICTWCDIFFRWESTANWNSYTQRYTAHLQISEYLNLFSCMYAECDFTNSRELISDFALKPRKLLLGLTDFRLTQHAFEDETSPIRTFFFYLGFTIYINFQLLSVNNN